MRLIAESLIGFQINLGKELYRQAVYKLNVIKILPVNPNHEPAEMKEDERAGMK